MTRFDDVSAPEQLKARREAVGLTQRAVGDQFDPVMTSAAVSKWENGLSHPDRDTVLRLDEILEADGELIAAFGYSDTGETATLRLLREVSARLDVLAAEAADDRRDLRAELAKLVDSVDTWTGHLAGTTPAFAEADIPDTPAVEKPQRPSPVRGSRKSARARS